MTTAETAPRRSPWYWVRHHLGWSLALLVLLVALGVALLRLALPGVDYLREDLEAWASAELGLPVRTEGIGAEWRGWTPVLRFDGVRLLGPEGRPFLQLSALLVEFKPWESLRSLELRPSHLIARGAEVTLERDADGTIRLCCLKGGPAAGAEPPDLGQWLLGESRLEIDDTVVRLRDAVTGGDAYDFTGVEAVLVNEDGGSRLRGRARVPPALGGEVSFAVDLIPTEDAVTATAFLGFSGLRLGAAPLTRLLPAGASVGGGSADLRVWLDWRDGGVARAHAEAAVRDLSVAVTGHALPAADFDAAARYVRAGTDRWEAAATVTAAADELVTGGRRVRLEAAGDGRGTLDHLAAATDRVDLARARPFIAALVHGTGMAGVVDDRVLEGVVADLALSVAPAAPAESLRLRANLTGLGIARHGQAPGVSGITGRLTAGSGRARLVLPGSALEVDATHLFRTPLAADHLAGELWARAAADHWDLRIQELVLHNPDIRLRLTGDVRVPAGGGAPHLNLVGTFDDSRLDRVSAYLPTAVMAEDAVRWLDRGLVSGRIHNGGLVIRGQADRFPWDDGSGRLEARALLEQGIIDYQDGWPRLEEVEAEAVFVGRSMTINGSSAKLLGAEARDVRAFSPDLDADDVRLRITGEVRGPGQDGMRVLLETPLRRRFEDHLGGARVSGEIAMDLDLDLLLDSGDTTLDGTIHFLGNDLTFPLLDVPLADTTGRLHITDEGLDGEGLTASLDGVPVQIGVETVKSRTEDLIRVRLGGALDAPLLARYRVPWAAHAAGRSTWQATLDIPNDITAGPPTRLRVASGLKGLALRLPAPLGKEASTSLPLVVEGTLDSDDGRRRLEVSLGDHVRGQIRMRGGDGGVTVEQAAVRVGPGPVREGPVPGLYITGALAVLDADRWVPLAVEVTEGGDDDGRVEMAFAGLDLEAATLRALDQDFPDARVTVAAPREERLAVEVAAPAIAGTATVPLTAAGGPIRGELERLHLATGEGGGDGRTIDPRDIPSLDLTCLDCRLDELDLGRSELAMRPLPRGTAIERLTIESDVFTADASGEWIMETGDSHRTLVKGQLETADLGAFLKAVGYRESGIAEGRADTRLELTWAGPPTDFSLARSTGELELTVRDGRLEDVEPGAAGRFFGLLSINALPRRLLLDFRDLFGKGLSFDRIEGSFTIDSGDAYTNNLTMDAPSARIDVAGRVGLAAEDYDEVVTVTPKVSSTLPVAGAIAGGPVGAAVGAAATFLSRNVLKTEVGGAIKTQYEVTGSWADPQVVKVGADGEPVGGESAKSGDVEVEVEDLLE